MPELNGAQQVEQEAALLAESYAYAAQREVSQVTLQQHQARLAELVHRQQFRAASGHALLTPVQAQGHRPAPAPVEPEPEPMASPMRLVVGGEVLDTRPVLRRDDPGTVQRQQEATYRAMNMVEAAKVAYVNAAGRTVYYTPADRARQQATENAYAAREQWRRDQGQDYCPTELEWLRGQMEPTPEAPAADEA